jgi:hypothetical protein
LKFFFGVTACAVPFALSEVKVAKLRTLPSQCLPDRCNILGIDERIFMKFGKRNFTELFRDGATFVELGQAFRLVSQAELAKYLSDGKCFGQKL